MKKLFLLNLVKLMDSRILKLSFILPFMMILSSNAVAQTITSTNYAFNRATAGPNAWTWNSLIVSGSDNVASPVTDIGFTFWFAGAPYTQFSVSENGLLTLGSIQISGTDINNDMASGITLPKIAPYWDDLATGTNGSVGYYLQGTAPNRTLYVNWNVTIPKNIGGAANAVLQVKLLEATNQIILNHGAILGNSGAATIGIGKLSTDYASVTASGSTASCAYYPSASNNNNNTAIAQCSYNFTPDYTAPPITYTTIPSFPGTANRILTATIADYQTGVPTSGSFVPRIYYKKGVGGTYVSTAGVFTSGTATNAVFTFTVDHSLLGGVTVGDQIYYYVIAQDQSASGEPNIASNPTGVVATDVNTIITPPTTPNIYTLGADFSGIKTVGTGGDYESLTLLGGLFDQINAGQLTNNLTVSIISDLTAETGLIALNAWVNGTGGPFTLTINPVGNRIVSGITVNGGKGSVIPINGATGLTIDGLNDGTNSLTFIQTGQYYVGAVIDLKGASNNTITRCAIKAYGASNSGIMITTTGIPASNNTISYCDITSSVLIPNTANSGYGIVLVGSTFTDATGNNNLISHNTVYNFVYGGIVTTHQNFTYSGKFSNTTISDNEIYNTIGTSWNSNFRGILIGTAIVGTTNIFNNKVHDILIQSAGTGLIPGIITTGGTGTTTNIYNNVISLDASFTHLTQGWAGIQTTGLGAVNIYYNSIYIGGSSITGTASSYGIKKDGTGVTNIKDNAVFNARSNSTGTGKHYGIYIVSTTSITSNYNDIYTNGTGGFFGFSTLDRLTLADWQTATGKDANSLSADPQYTSATNLYPLNLALNAATPIAGYTTDILGLARHETTPTIGAYELPKPTCVNPTSGGSIASNQSGCGPFNPALITSSVAPSGYFGTLEYKWQSSETSNSAGFTDIASSNADSYDPGPLTVTTWFKRLARVDCKVDWTGAAESNVVMVTVNNCDMTLNLTGIMLEGLYNAGGTMNQARDEAGLRWPAGVADHITVELHNAANFNVIVYSAADVPLSTTGTASVIIPYTFSASYFITIRHHNTIETTTAAAVSFATSIINQSFGTPANVYGGNLGLSIDGYYFFYGGDVNQNGILESNDMTPIDNLSSSFGYGLAEDVNCDGIVDSRDMTIVDNNSTAFISASHP